MIIVSMGSVPYAQLISVPISLISLSFSAVKAYCSMRQGDEAETDPDIKFLILKIFPLMLDSIICSLVLCTYVVGFMGPWAIPHAFFTWFSLKLNTWWHCKNNEKDSEMQKMGDHVDPRPEEKENFEVKAAMTGTYVPCIIGNVQKTLIITAAITLIVKLLVVFAVLISAHFTNFWPKVRHGKISLLGCLLPNSSLLEGKQKFEYFPSRLFSTWVKWHRT